ncbi:MAG: DUF1905 domain-containing protein [Actinomycetia bacterium]|nr:DUF1905 domain-containing protein [Actinomycetes bacterium]
MATKANGEELSFSGEIWYWRGPSPYHFVTVPEAQATEIRDVAREVTYGWGMIPVEVRVGDTKFQTSLWPKNGGYIVPIKDVVRRAEEVDDGDVIDIQMSVRRKR